MSEKARRDAFWQQIKLLREQPRRLDQAEIAARAVAAGFSISEALAAVLEYSEIQRTKSNELTAALARFVSSLCRDEGGRKRILEFACLPLLLTADLAEGEQARRLSVVVENTSLSDVMRAILGDRGSSVLQSVQAIPSGATYASIVCVPAIGLRRSDDGRSDGFGGELVRVLVERLEEGGTFLWVTARGVLTNRKPRKTLDELEQMGLHVCARIDTAPSVFPGTTNEGAVIILRRTKPVKMFTATLRDFETAEPTASAFSKGPTSRSGANWTWLEPDDGRSFFDLEQRRLLDKLMPRGRHEIHELSQLLVTQTIERADREVNDTGDAGRFLFVPEYAGSRVTADLDEQTVNSKAVYRLVVDPRKANARFLALVLNSAYGRHTRAAAASGATIQRLSGDRLLALEIPLPDLTTQEHIARVDSDIGLLRSACSEMQATIQQDWNSISEIHEKVDGLKGVLDIERRIADWWRELPYPLAAIYRRHQVSTDSKERLETLLHFFEMGAVYLAAVGSSHVKALRIDWQDVLARWLHPKGAAGIERADFGFWIGLAAASLKDLNRISSDKEIRAGAIEKAGHELVQVAGAIGELGKATEVLDVARRYRNTWKGHGGHLKRSDAARLDGELQQAVRDLYETTAPIFRDLILVRPGMAEVSETSFSYEIESLVGSDPTFARQRVELQRPANSRALAFWMKDAKAMCRALPFFRLGAPQQPQETSCYVFNRVENGGLRWISYQEAREQEFVAPDEELLGLIALRRDGQ